MPETPTPMPRVDTGTSPGHTAQTSNAASPHTPDEPMRLSHERAGSNDSKLPFPAKAGARPSWRTTMLSPSPSPEVSPVERSAESRANVEQIDRAKASSDQASPSRPATMSRPSSSTSIDDLPVLARPVQSINPARTPSPLSRPRSSNHRSLSPETPALASATRPRSAHSAHSVHSAHSSPVVGLTQTARAAPAPVPGYRSPPPLRLDTTSPIRELSPHAPHLRADANIRRTPEQDLSRRLRAPQSPTAQLPAVYRTQEQLPPGREIYPTPITVIERERLRWPSAHEQMQMQLQMRMQMEREMDGLPVHDPARYYAVDGYAPPPTMTRAQAPMYVSSHFSAPPPGGDYNSPRAGHPSSTYAMMRPRLSIHPYAPPMVPVGDSRYYSAGPMAAHRSLSMADRNLSPSSAISPGSFKAPRKRADDSQLSILTEVFERTSYPSTEEREDLARQLGMTSRSVQIWFQNRRRAVKVEQQSAIQRAEADARARAANGPPLFLHGQDMSVLPRAGLGVSPASSSGSMPEFGGRGLARGDVFVRQAGQAGQAGQSGPTAQAGQTGQAGQAEQSGQAGSVSRRMSPDGERR